METTFSRWLAENGYTPYRFASDNSLNAPSIYRLAGIRAARTETSVLTDKLLREVWALTGIAPDVLLREALVADFEPRPARKYRRRQREDAA